MLLRTWIPEIQFLCVPAMLGFMESIHAVPYCSRDAASAVHQGPALEILRLFDSCLGSIRGQLLESRRAQFRGVQSFTVRCGLLASYAVPRVSVLHSCLNVQRFCHARF
jgi:hypothetical protein